MSQRLDQKFFERDVLHCARELIGTRLVCGACSGIVIETEAYSAIGDEAAHTFFRPSAREFIARHTAGAAYVYLNYGMYWLANVLIKGPDGDGFVLLRALHPERSVAAMQQRRQRDKPRDLCSGPGKLTIALGIDGNDHGGTFVDKTARFWFESAPNPIAVETDTRIGINRSTELPWRFLAADNDFVSKKKGG